jgi:hypothetical protein
MLHTSGHFLKRPFSAWAEHTPGVGLRARPGAVKHRQEPSRVGYRRPRPCYEEDELHVRRMIRKAAKGRSA